MTAQTDRVFINTRVRLVSDDFNNETRLNAKNLLEGISALTLGNAYKVAADGIGGVLGGLEVEALPGTNSVRVKRGIALVQATPADANYDPPLYWIELAADEDIDLAGLIDPVNPRLVTIEIEANDVTKISQVVDVFDPNTGTFTVANLPVLVGSQPTITATAGAAAVAPQIPAGTVGRLPLAVVKVAGNQVSYPDAFVPVLLCRPMLSAGGSLEAPTGFVEGGGVSLGEEAGGLIAAASVPYLSDVQAELDGYVATAAGVVSFAGTITARTPNSTSPPVLINGTGPVYGYLATPPWPNDYGNIAPRECRVRNPNSIDLASEPTSVVFGDGSTFLSLLVINHVTTAGPLVENCIIIWDSVAPSGTNFGAAGNAPLRVSDKRGPHPTTAGGGVITLDQTQDPSWGNTQQVTDTVYIGGLSGYGAVSAFMGQVYRGNGRVQIIDRADLILASGNRPVFQTTATSGGLTPLYPGRFPGMLVGDTEVIPASADQVEVGINAFMGTAGGNSSVLIGEVFGFGDADPASGLGLWSFLNDAASNPDVGISNYEVFTRDATDALQYSTVAVANFTVTFHLRGYWDIILAART